MVVTIGVMALLQSSVEVDELSSEMKVYYLASPEEVLDEGEGLEVVDGHDGVEEPDAVGADIGHGLICYDFYYLRFVLMDIFQF